MPAFLFLTVSLAYLTFQLHGGLAVTFPERVHVMEGRDVLLRLKLKNPDQMYCLLKTPNTSVTYQLVSDSMDSEETLDKVKFWGTNRSTDCGARIHNIGGNDIGYWRLTSVSHNYVKVEGVSKIFLGQKSINKRLLIGTKPILELGELEYCPAVHRNTKYTKAQKEPRCIEDEILNFGWKVHNLSTESISIFCNTKCKQKLMSCYFIRLQDQATFSIVDGTGTDRYSYFGEGLCSGECGISIESPQQIDYGRWQCIVTTPHKNLPLSAFISVSTERRDFTEPENLHVWNSGSTVLLSGQPLTLKCRVEAEISQCSLYHPNGSVIVLYPQTNQDGMWKYEGLGMQVGDCGGTLSVAAAGESGLWKCEMKTLKPEEKIYTADIEVKVTNIPFVPVTEVFERQIDDKVTIGCQTLPPKEILEYCFFKRADGTTFNSDENATAYKYFMEGGLCQLTVTNLQKGDFGNWTCTGKFFDEQDEMSTVIIIRFTDTSLQSASAGVLGGTAIIVGAIMGLIFYQRFQHQRTQHSNEEMVNEEEIEMQEVH